MIALRQRLGFWPMPTFEFREWAYWVDRVSDTSLSPFFLHVSRCTLASAHRILLRYCCGDFECIGAHGCHHSRSHSQLVTFQRPAPGFYSSPLLFATACFVLLQLRAQTLPAGMRALTQSAFDILPNVNIRRFVPFSSACNG